MATVKGAQKRWTGVTRRKAKYKVEMRLPGSNLKLHLGSYKSKEDATVARDYGEFLKASVVEMGAAAEGSGAGDRLYELAESQGIFESMKRARVRRDEVRLLYQMEKENRSDDEFLRKFREEARRDIKIAIGLFLNDASHLSARGSTDLVPERYPEGHACPERYFLGETEIAIISDGSLPQVWVAFKAPFLDRQRLLLIVSAFMHKLEDDFKHSCYDEFFQDVEPCNIDPQSYVRIDEPEPET